MLAIVLSLCLVEVLCRRRTRLGSSGIISVVDFIPLQMCVDYVAGGDVVERGRTLKISRVPCQASSSSHLASFSRLSLSFSFSLQLALRHNITTTTTTASRLTNTPAGVHYEVSSCLAVEIVKHKHAMKPRQWHSAAVQSRETPTKVGGRTRHAETTTSGASRTSNTHQPNQRRRICSRN